ncbi:ATP-grasp fold amidoligase family protein [Collinsella ihumii]|uniref:ATP-grasp fold amidoligase family protein n=1 Tax=Collinsella ihumii TaxID=1720204 RepID=UPI0025AAC1ED|nr:ATP-grasp fold amidoligase family protein [Collinsella ihumii]MDN0055085.1 ATP-grasp fold amidoligase family protein [Collinsella ihumii]
MSSGSLGRSVYRRILANCADIFGTKKTKILEARLRFHRNLNLDHPSSLADKISWIELHGDQAAMARLTDKFEVRNYVVKRGLEECLIPLCGGPWTNAGDINLSELPGQFVLKATHGCEMNYICKDKSKLDTADLMAHAQEWLANDYSRACVEPHYRLIPHRLYAEVFVGGMEDTIDYKFHCINGEPRFILTCSNREKGLKLNLYDTAWKAVGGLQGLMKNPAGISRPDCLAEMIEVARTLSADFDFVRVDLYEKDNKVYFGELTFTPAVGVLPYFTDGFIERWGEKLRVTGLD